MKGEKNVRALQVFGHALASRDRIFATLK